MSVKLSSRLVLTFSIVFVILSFFHEGIFFYIQKGLKLNRGVNIGCAHVVMGSKNFALKLIGGNKVGMKYYGFIPISMHVDFEGYAVFVDSSSRGEIYFQSMTNSEKEQALKLIKLYGKSSRSGQHSFDRVNIDGFNAIKNISDAEERLEMYTFPELKVKTTFKNISYKKGVISFTRINNCS